MPSCKACQKEFHITDRDLEYYRRIKVPSPTLCLDCRRQRRLAFRNERNLYTRTCDLSGRHMITMYSPYNPCKVYHHEEWWSDKWDALDYGLDFDFSRPFFEQFHELQHAVPRMSMIISHCENSDYAPYSVDSRNCYMCVSSNGSEDVCYSYQCNTSRDCLDCSLSYDCELCYECVYCVKVYRGLWSVSCNDCSDIYFCRDCSGCRNCIGCANLKNKSYYIFNKPSSQQEFEDFVKKFGDLRELEKFVTHFYDFSKKFPFRSSYTIGSENVSGDYILNSKNADYCFEVENQEDCKFMYTTPHGGKDCYDCHYTQHGELCYEAISAVKDYNCKFVLHSWECKNSSYIQECYFSSDLFGCIGLRQKHYCILNKQYSEKEYRDLVPRIIAHMKDGGEWGEYWPMSMSLYGYNESLAQEFYPLSVEEAIDLGLKWKAMDERDFKPSSYVVSPLIAEVDDDIVGQVLACGNCDKNYKLIAPELKFYKRCGVPIPRMCPDCRHKSRMRFRRPCKLEDRNCDKCGNAIKTSCDLVHFPVVYCEKCFVGDLE